MKHQTLWDKLISQGVLADQPAPHMDTRCLEWQGALTKLGYGNVKWKGVNLFPHRVAWEEFNGPIPPGMRVLHRCDNRRCFHPKHLFVGTAADNTADMVAKGRAWWQR